MKINKPFSQINIDFNRILIDFNEKTEKLIDQNGETTETYTNGQEIQLPKEQETCRKEHQKQRHYQRVGRMFIVVCLSSSNVFTFRPLIKKEWQQGKSLAKNLDDMGLAFDTNKALSVPNNREQRKHIIRVINGFVEEEDLDIKEEEVTDEEDVLEEDDKTQSKSKRVKAYVAEKLERDANEYVESRFRLPKGVVKQCSYYMDKYGLDYKAMARDSQNHYQETWRQIRAKCRKFMSISDQFAQYLEKRGLLDIDIKEDDPRWKECETDDD